MRQVKSLDVGISPVVIVDREVGAWTVSPNSATKSGTDLVLEIDIGARCWERFRL